MVWVQCVWWVFDYFGCGYDNIVIFFYFLQASNISEVRTFLRVFRISENVFYKIANEVLFSFQYWNIDILFYSSLHKYSPP